MPTATLPFFNAFRSLWYRGSGVECPVCGHSFRKLMPGGNNRRPNARCPLCDSLERHRLLWLFIRDRTNILSKTCSLLHFAPEPCFIRVLGKQKNITYTSADLSSQLALVHTDITDMKFTDASFDYIICSHVLEHIPDDAKALSELYRVTKPDGMMLLMVPLDYTLATTIEDAPESTPELRREKFGATDHVRLYGKDFCNRVEKSGFTVAETDVFTSYPREIQKKYALVDEEHIFMCRKKKK